MFAEKKTKEQNSSIIIRCYMRNHNLTKCVFFFLNKKKVMKKNSNKLNSRNMPESAAWQFRDKTIWIPCECRRRSTHDLWPIKCVYETVNRQNVDQLARLWTNITSIFFFTENNWTLKQTPEKYLILFTSFEPHGSLNDF